MRLIAKKFNELSLKELYEILKARAKIFIGEQKINYVDMDDIDYDSMHLFFMENNSVIAYLRAFYLKNDNNIIKIGRVLTLKHGNGVGKELMMQSLKLIKEETNCKEILIDAQKQAVGFYKKFGFKVISDDFLEEGIVHNAMKLEL